MASRGQRNRRYRARRKRARGTTYHIYGTIGIQPDFDLAEMMTMMRAALQLPEPTYSGYWFMEYRSYMSGFLARRPDAFSWVAAKGPNADELNEHAELVALEHDGDGSLRDTLVAALDGNEPALFAFQDLINDLCAPPGSGRGPYTVFLAKEFAPNGFTQVPVLVVVKAS
jgi:hypothetical protein